MGDVSVVCAGGVASAAGRSLGKALAELLPGGTRCLAVVSDYTASRAALLNFPAEAEAAQAVFAARCPSQSRPRPPADRVVLAFGWDSQPFPSSVGLPYSCPAFSTVLQGRMAGLSLPGIVGRIAGEAGKGTAQEARRPERCDDGCPLCDRLGAAMRRCLRRLVGLEEGLCRAEKGLGQRDGRGGPCVGNGAGAGELRRAARLERIRWTVRTLFGEAPDESDLPGQARRLCADATERHSGDRVRALDRDVQDAVCARYGAEMSRRTAKGKANPWDLLRHLSTDIRQAGAGGDEAKLGAYNLRIEAALFAAELTTFPTALYVRVPSGRDRYAACQILLERYARMLTRARTGSPARLRP